MFDSTRPRPALFIIKSESTALVLGHHMKRHRMSYETASNISDVANWALVIRLVVGVAATFAIWYTGHIKEEHWDREREHSKERIAVLDNETELLKSENLALQTAIAPRSMVTAPNIKEIYMELRQLAETQPLIQQ